MAATGARLLLKLRNCDFDDRAKMAAIDAEDPKDISSMVVRRWEDETEALKEGSWKRFATLEPSRLDEGGLGVFSACTKLGGHPGVPYVGKVLWEAGKDFTMCPNQEHVRKIAKLSLTEEEHADRKDYLLCAHRKSQAVVLAAERMSGKKGAFLGYLAGFINDPYYKGAKGKTNEKTGKVEANMEFDAFGNTFFKGGTIRSGTELLVAYQNNSTSKKKPKKKMSSQAKLIDEKFNKMSLEEKAILLGMAPSHGAKKPRSAKKRDIVDEVDEADWKSEVEDEDESSGHGSSDTEYEESSSRPKRTSKRKARSSSDKKESPAKKAQRTSESGAKRSAVVCGQRKTPRKTSKKTPSKKIPKEPAQPVLDPKMHYVANFDSKSYLIKMPKDCKRKKVVTVGHVASQATKRLLREGVMEECDVVQVRRSKSAKAGTVWLTADDLDASEALLKVPKTNEKFAGLHRLEMSLCDKSLRNGGKHCAFTLNMPKLGTKKGSYLSVLVPGDNSVEDVMEALGQQEWLNDAYYLEHKGEAVDTSDTIATLGRIVDLFVRDAEEEEDQGEAEESDVQESSDEMEDDVDEQESVSSFQ